ncbi:HU family DNA-binding protein [Microlunatus sp. GCM10028923]|uniref:HU family DNA-binding protein n=1 Tax=Microlunatus sp. GCM10028923 TaxID=3273400 RepID=UPI00360FD5D3
MNRAELTTAIAKETELTKDSVDRVLDALAGTLEKAVSSGDEVKWPGVFTLDVVDRAARQGRNPQTGEAIEIAASKAARLRPGTRLKKAATA